MKTILNGNDYLELGKLLIRVKRSWYEESALVFPVTKDGLSISLRVDNGNDSGVFVCPPKMYYSSRQPRKNKPVLLVFDGDIVSPNSILIEENLIQPVKQSLDRIMRILRFCENACCSYAQENFYRYNWSMPLNFCQFCGEATGIEVVKEVSDNRFNKILAMH